MSALGKEALQAGSTKNHPVWELYNELRTARLNVKCLECRIKSIRRRANFVDGAIAIAGTSSIGGFWFLQNVVGTTLWKTLGAIAILLGAVKPLYPLTERRMKKERLAAGYRMLEQELRCICLGVKERGAYDDVAKAEFRVALNNKRLLIAQSEDDPCSQRVERKCRMAVSRELPVENFFVPN